MSLRHTARLCAMPRYACHDLPLPFSPSLPMPRHAAVDVGLRHMLRHAPCFRQRLMLVAISDADSDFR